MRVIRSAGQNVSPSDDGRLFDQAFTDGLFEEATITATGGNTITLSALYGIICGRDFTAEAQTISATLPDSDATTGYVYVEFDTSSEDIITIGTALAPFTPTYEDINTNGAVVQMVIAQYEASAVAVTSVTPTYMTATAGSVKAGSIATVEKSPAVANHSIGEFILYGGDLYEVTSAIAAGETLVVGTNIAAASIGEELTALNNGLITQEVTEIISTGNKLYAIKTGDIVTLQTTGNGIAISTSGIQIPTAFAPESLVQIIVPCYTSDWTYCRARIEPSGVITVYGGGSKISASYVCLNVTYALGFQ